MCFNSIENFGQMYKVSKTFNTRFSFKHEKIIKNGFSRIGNSAFHLKYIKWKWINLKILVENGAYRSFTTVTLNHFMNKQKIDTTIFCFHWNKKKRNKMSKICVAHKPFDVFKSIKFIHISKVFYIYEWHESICGDKVSI